MAPHFRKILEVSRILFTSIRHFVKLQNCGYASTDFPFRATLSPSHRLPRAFFFSHSPASLRHEEAAAEERDTIESGLKVIRGQFAPTNSSATIGNLTSTCFKYSKWFAHCRRTSYCIYSIWSFALTVPGVISKVLSNVSRHI